MKISKYKKGSNGIYKVVLEDGRTLSLYEDVILKFNFLIVRDIDEKTIIEAEKYNQECDVYYVALKSIRSRLRSSYELQRFLLHKQYPTNLIDKAIHKLEKQGYLNDQLFARSYIYHQMITTNKGPLKIEKELLEKKVSNGIINEELVVFSSEEQAERIDKLVKKSIKTNRSFGGIVLMRKICNGISNLGYDSSLIRSVLSNYSFENDVDIAKREYEKLYHRYCHKYSGEDLKRKIREKLFLKGLSCDDEFFNNLKGDW